MNMKKTIFIALLSAMVIGCNSVNYSNYNELEETTKDIFSVKFENDFNKYQYFGSNEEIEYSKTYVQTAETNTSTYLRFATAVKGDLKNLTWTRTVDGDVRDNIEINTIYSGIYNNNQIVYFNGTDVTNDETYKGMYYWVVYVIRFDSDNKKESDFTLQLNITDNQDKVLFPESRTTSVKKQQQYNLFQKAKAETLNNSTIEGNLTVTQENQVIQEVKEDISSGTLSDTNLRAYRVTSYIDSEIGYDDFIFGSDVKKEFYRFHAESDWGVLPYAVFGDVFYLERYYEAYLQDELNSEMLIVYLCILLNDIEFDNFIYSEDEDVYKGTISGDFSAIFGDVEIKITNGIFEYIKSKGSPGEMNSDFSFIFSNVGKTILEMPTDLPSFADAILRNLLRQEPSINKGTVVNELKLKNINGNEYFLSNQMSKEALYNSFVENQTSNQSGSTVLAVKCREYGATNYIYQQESVDLETKEIVTSLEEDYIYYNEEQFEHIQSFQKDTCSNGNLTINNKQAYYDGVVNLNLDMVSIQHKEYNNGEFENVENELEKLEAEKLVNIPNRFTEIFINTIHSSPRDTNLFALRMTKITEGFYISDFELTDKYIIIKKIFYGDVIDSNGLGIGSGLIYETIYLNHCIEEGNFYLDYKYGNQIVLDTDNNYIEDILSIYSFDETATSMSQDGITCFNEIFGS